MSLPFDTGPLTDVSNYVPSQHPPFPLPPWTIVVIIMIHLRTSLSRPVSLREDPNDILFGRSRRSSNIPNKHTMYYKRKIWAWTIVVYDRLPLLNATERSLKWINVEKIFTAYMPVIEEIYVALGLPFLILPTAGTTSDIESVYNLLRSTYQQLAVWAKDTRIFLLVVQEREGGGQYICSG